jgi:hypothetical protein
MEQTMDSNLAHAEHHFDRQGPAEPVEATDEQVALELASISEALIKTIKADDAEASELFNDAVAECSDEANALVLRLALNNEPTALLQAMTTVIGDRIKRLAIKQLKDMSEAGQFPMIFGHQVAL